MPPIFKSRSLVDMFPPTTEADQMPQSWFVVFHDKTPRWWLRWLSFGKFKHVSCFGWVENADRWVFFDPALERTWLRLVSDDDACREPLHEFDIKAGYYGGDIGHYTNQGVVLKIAVQVDDIRKANIGIGRGCVRDVARLIGLRTRAIRPDAFFRDCLKAGGEVIAYRGKVYAPA